MVLLQGGPGRTLVRSRVADYLRRRQPPPIPRSAALAGIAGATTIAALGLLSQLTGMPWLVASLGASCVLVFLAPDVAFSQPVNVIGGHLVATVCGLLVATVLPHTWWSAGLGVGLAITAMAVLRLTHPPAGGNPIMIMVSGAGWSTLLTPILTGTVVLVVAGVVFHRLRRHPYPLRG